MPDLQDELQLPPTMQVRRYMIRWCRRMGALLLLLVIAWCVWFMIAKARLAHEIEQGRLSGFPATIDQLSPMEICEDPKAMGLYRRIANTVYDARYEYQQWRSDLPSRWSQSLAPSTPTVPPPELSEAMTLLEQVHAIPWPAQGTEARAPSTQWKAQDNVWELEQFLISVATAAHLEHDDNKALLCIADTIRVCAIRSAANQRGWATADIPSGDALDFLTCYFFELRIGSSAAPSTPARAAIQQIINHLEEGPEAASRREQWFRTSYTPSYAAWGTGRGLWSPREMLAQAACGKAVRTAAACCRAASAPEAFAQFPPASRSYRAPESLMWSLARQHYSAIARQRIVRAMLAVALYRADHDALPESLGDLAPSYLPELPVDPFDVGKGPLRYVPKPRAFALYSVGVDGSDNHPASPTAVDLGGSCPDLGVWISQTAPSATSPANNPADTPTTADSQ